MILIASKLADLQRPLQDTDWKAADRFRCQPQPEVRMRLVELFQLFFQLLQPMDKKMTVLEHEPLSSVDGGV